jgi:hypothetical protein
MEKRPIAHLENHHVFAKGVLKTWQRPANGHVAVLLTHVLLTDYDTDKKVLAPVLDHCWIWPHDTAWETMNDCHTTFKNQFTLLDEVHCVCRVEGYRRRNGTCDYGLRLINCFPVTLAQRKAVRKAHEKAAKYYKKGKSNAKNEPVTVEDLCFQHLALTTMDLRMEDWRCHAQNQRDAKSQIKQNIANLAGYLIPILGVETINAEVNRFMLEEAIPEIQFILKRCVNWQKIPSTSSSPAFAAGEAIKMKPQESTFLENLLTDRPCLSPDPTFLARVVKQPLVLK